MNKNTARKKMKAFILYAFSALLISTSASSVIANPDHIQDIAKVLNSSMSSKLEKFLTELETNKNLHVEVVILPNLYGKPHDAVLEAFFQQMGQNAPEAEKRILLMLTLDSNTVNLVTTPNLATIYTDAASEDIIKNVTLKLNEKNYDEAVRVGVAGIYHYFSKNPAKQNTAMNWMKMGFNILIVAIVLVGAFMFTRKKPTETNQ